jgi:hypothetical protein
MGSRGDYAYGQSQYLRAADLAGRTDRVTIIGVEDVEFEKGQKPVLTFEGKTKKLVVNATNFDTLADAFGGFTENWIGKSIVLAGEKITVRGQRTDTIKVRAAAQARAPVNTQSAEVSPDPEEVPF